MLPPGQSTHTAKKTSFFFALQRILEPHHTSHTDGNKLSTRSSANYARFHNARDEYALFNSRLSTRVLTKKKLSPSPPLLLYISREDFDAHRRRARQNTRPPD